MSKLRTYAIAFLSLLLYFFLAFHADRPETLKLQLLYFLLFTSYVLVISDRQASLRFWIFSAIIFRMVFVGATPALSDDFYRFIWDGRLWQAGIHPFAQVPSFYAQLSLPGIDPDLYAKLNSKEYFTVYPPVAQLIFWLSVKFSPTSVYGSMLVMKLLVLLAETGTLLLMIRILDNLNAPKRAVLLHALNPLVVVELTGNLHFEAFMIFFLLLAIYLMMRTRWMWASAAWALAICSKLVPLLLLPALVSATGWKKSFWLYAGTFVFVLTFFLPMLNWDLVNGFQQSLGYYFKKFEFNASIYYLVRYWGFSYYGYNIIGTVGWKLGAVAGMLIFILAGWNFIKSQRAQSFQFDRNFFSVLVFSLLIHLLFSTIVHPWYVLPLVALSVFTPFRFPIVWSALIFVTYTGYSTAGYVENLQWVMFEYIGVLLYAIWELHRHQCIRLPYITWLSTGTSE